MKYSCRKCLYFQKKNWKQIYRHWWQRIGCVAGHCVDRKNVEFNEFAQVGGRGVKRVQSFFVPRWCRFRQKGKPERIFEKRGDEN